MLPNKILLSSAVEPPGMRQTVPSRVALTRALNVSPAIEIDSAAVGHRGHFPELAGVDGQSATMMRGVLDHGPDNVADGLAALALRTMPPLTTPGPELSIVVQHGSYPHKTGSRR